MYAQQSKPKSSEPLLKRVLAAYQATHGAQSPEAADAHAYLGKCLDRPRQLRCGEDAQSKSR